MLLLAEALLEECLQENLELLRRCTPLTDQTQPSLSRAKGHLNGILSRGRLTVSTRRRSTSRAAFRHRTGNVFPPPAAPTSERGAAADGQSPLRAGALPGRAGDVCQGRTGGADPRRAARLPPPPAGRGLRHQR